MTSNHNDYPERVELSPSQLLHAQRRCVRGCWAQAPAAHLLILESLRSSVCCTYTLHTLYNTISQNISAYRNKNSTFICSPFFLAGLRLLDGFGYVFPPPPTSRHRLFHYLSTGVPASGLPQTAGLLLRYQNYCLLFVEFS